MKIAQIVCSFPPYQGGMGNSAYRLSQLLKPDIEIDTYTTLKSKKRNKQKNTNRENKLDNTYYLKPLIKIGQAAILPGLFFKLKKYDAIILHLPFFGSAEILYLYRLFNKKQKLYIFYHMDVTAKNPLYKILSTFGNLAGKKLLKSADNIIVSSIDYIKNSKIKNFYHKNLNKFTEINFHINDNYFYKDQKIKDINNIQLLFVGGLDKAHYFKGVEQLIVACSKLKQKNWTLNIVGSGDLLTKYKKLTETFKLNNKIHFLNKISDDKLQKIYQSSDVMILPSLNRNEAFGIVLIEAMANSNAIIASNLPGVRQVFNRNCGLHVEPKNINKLQNSLDELLKNTKTIENFKNQAYKLAKNKYSSSAIKEKWLKILKNPHENSFN